MTDHSEFPWGPQYEPGLLTPLGAIGWVVAAALLLALILGMAGPPARRAGAAHLDEVYKVILTAARFALKQDEFGILRGADVLRRVIKSYLGGLLLAGGSLGKQVKALNTALGEKDDKDKKKGDKHGKDAQGKGGHGGGGHGAHAAPAAHGGGHGDPPSAVANTVQGHSITVNVGGDGHGGHEEEHEEEEEKPLSLEEQLVALRKAVREFETWWSDKPSRIAELRAAHDDLTIPKKPDPALVALFEEKK
ncbi:MAG: hypothetical protein Q7T19_15100 [Caulobacter sp.]|nr:hypothetical protein [Caulobacter sp.]